jgi:hypothetical protein
MTATEEILSELEAVTERMARTGEHSLEGLGELCDQRGELIRELDGRLDGTLLERAKAVLLSGDDTARTLDTIRKSLRQDLRDLERSVHVARQWGANVAVPRGGMTIDA